MLYHTPVLTQIQNPVEALDSLGLEPARIFTLRNFLKGRARTAEDEAHELASEDCPPDSAAGSGEALDNAARVSGGSLGTGTKLDALPRVFPIALADDPRSPNVLMAHEGAHFMMAARDHSYWPGAMEDLLNGRIEQEPAWPDPLTEKHWKYSEEKENRRKGLFLDQAPLAAWEAAIAAGFAKDVQHDYNETYAHVWFETGPPRLKDYVNHTCRLGNGLELLEYLKQGISYDREGVYIRMCLENGPSFVCEIDGNPVCWSCTHLSGAMGMIYTPEEHRRKGYARSLAAFQIDHMLTKHNIAVCHVIEGNTASQELLRSIGFSRIEDPLVWRPVVWP